MMLGFACVVVGVLVTFVLPQITQLLESLNQPLPFYTRWIIAGSDFTRDLVVGGAAGLGGAFVLAFRAAIRTERGRVRWDAFKLRMPVVGRVVRLLAISRFSRTLSTLLAGGLPIVRALETASRGGRQHRARRRRSTRAPQSITEGASWRGRCARAGSSRRS